MQIDAARTLNELITSVSMAMDIEDGIKLYHGWRVAILAADLSRAMGRTDLVESFYGGLLHDVGGVALPHHLVHYLVTRATGRQHTERIMDPAVVSHPLLSAEIVSSLPGVDRAAKAVLDHHEDWNGHGFPRGLHDTEISVQAQILHAADTADLILRDAPPPSLDTTADRIAALASASFAPDVAECVIEELRGGLYESLTDADGLPDLFESTRAQVGQIPVEPGVDAVGVTLDVLSRVVDNKHPYTIGHSRRIARYSLLIGIAMGLNHDDLTLLKWAALIHDVGKLSLPVAMLDKPDRLSAQEYDLVQFHVSYTFDIVSMITDLRGVAVVAGSHHEHYDGTGYPLGRAGDEIPFGGRIMAVADAFDAMTSSRPYRTSNNLLWACDELKAKAGTQFDPGVVQVAVPVLRNLGVVIPAE